MNDAFNFEHMACAVPFCPLAGACSVRLVVNESTDGGMPEKPALSIILAELAVPVDRLPERKADLPSGGSGLGRHPASGRAAPARRSRHGRGAPWMPTASNCPNNCAMHRC